MTLGNSTQFVSPLRHTLLYFLGGSAACSWWPSLALPESLLSSHPRCCLGGWGVSLPRTSASPFLFLVGVALPVTSQAQPALWVRAVGPSLPSSLPGPSSTLSIPGWSSLSHCLIPGKGYLAGQGVGDRSQEESQCRKPPSPPGAHSSLQGSGPNASVIFRNLDF